MVDSRLGLGPRMFLRTSQVPLSPGLQREVRLHNSFTVLGLGYMGYIGFIGFIVFFGVYSVCRVYRVY